MKTIVIILGYRRSGSTILAKAIGCQSKCAALGEINYFNKEICGPDSPCGCGKKYYSCGYWREIINEINFERKVNIIQNRDTFDVEIGNEITKTKNMLSFLPTLFFNKQYKNKMLNDKISNSFYLFNKLFEHSKSNILIDSTKSIFRALILASHGKVKKIDFKFIFLVRDGRAVLNSTQKGFYNIKQEDGTLETTYVKTRNPKNEIKKWKFTNLLYLIILNIFRRGKFIKVKHEDFCNNPNASLKKICDFLNIKFEQDMIHLNKFENHILGGNTSRINAIEIKKSKESWRLGLKNNVLLQFNKKAGWINRILGYKV